MEGCLTIFEFYVVGEWGMLNFDSNIQISNHPMIIVCDNQEFNDGGKASALGC